MPETCFLNASSLAAIDTRLFSPPSLFRANTSRMATGQDGGLEIEDDIDNDVAQRHSNLEDGKLGFVDRVTEW